MKQIDDKTKALILRMKDEGSTQREVADALEISVRTIRKYWQTTTPASEPTDTGEGSTAEADDNTQILGINNIMSEDDSSSDSQVKQVKQDKLTGRHFWFVVYPSEAEYEAYYARHKDDCDADGVLRPHYDGADGYGTAPADWREQLQQTGLAFAVSPMHDRDTTTREVDGVMQTVPKKPHYHVIVSWPNTTTYRSARQICDMLHCPRPQLLRAVKGAYRYHQHMDDPDKYQYDEPSQAYNGWMQPLDSEDVARIKAEIADIIYLDDVQEYGELITVCKGYGPAYVDVASSYTIYCSKLCDSYRNNPLRCLIRYRALVVDDPDKLAIIDQHIEEITQSQQQKGR